MPNQTNLATTLSGNNNDVAMSPDGSLIYAAGHDGNLRVYNALTGQLEHTWHVGTNLGGLSISPDGSFLMATEQTPLGGSYSNNWTSDYTNTVTYKVDLSTGAVTDYPITLTGDEYNFSDSAVLANGMVLFSEEILPGWSGWVPYRTLNLSSGAYTASTSTVTQSDFLSSTSDGSQVLISQNNISDARLEMYQSGIGVVATHGNYQDNVQGYNSGVQAISGQAGLVAQGLGSTINIYNLSLQYQQNLSAHLPQLTGDVVAGLAFDSTGQNLYVLDSTASTIIQVSTNNWSTVETIPIGATIHNDGSQYSDSLIVSPDSHFFTILSAGNVLEVGNPALHYTFNGTSGDDHLTGTIFGDIINGGDGNDTLTGGAGADTLTGGAGNNIFQDTAAGLNGDTITDFTASDTIVISDATLSGFSFSLSGQTLTYTGGSLTLSSLPQGHFVASAAPGGGVELTIASSTPHNDFNGDGLSDILWRDDSGQLNVWSATSSGNFVTSFSTMVGNDWTVAGTGDFNGDGRQDIIWRNNSGQFTEWQATASGNFVTSFSTMVGNDWHVVGTGDFNGDGRTDVLWRNDNGQLLLWNANPDGTFTAGFSTLVGNDWHVAGTGDFNGDGLTDIIWRNDNGQFNEWQATSGGNFATSLSTLVGNDWHVAGTGDFNGDGKTDIVWRNDSGQLNEWQATTSGNFTTNFSTLVGNDWHVAGIGDFNGDGTDDLLWRNDSGQLLVWQADPNGTFAAGFSTLVGNDWHVQSPFG